MKADSLQISKVFSSGGDIHYVLPHFQREYAWGKVEWDTFLKDVFGIYEVYDDENPPEHFLGSLVVISDGTQAGTVPVFRLVDGQQRLTTISLLLAAMERVLADDEQYAVLRKKIHKHLVNEDESGHLYYKLLPTVKFGDRESYCDIIGEQKPDPKLNSNIPEAFEYLAKHLANRLKGDEFNPNQLFNVLMTSLTIVFINLDQKERPFEIFESLNFKGKALSQPDLVRNYLAMKLPANKQEAIYTDVWSPIEELLLEKRTVGRSRLGELTGFLRHYYAYHSGALINEEHVYSRFRDRGESLQVDEFVEELKRVNRFAHYYDRLLRPKNEPDKLIAQRLERLNVLENTTAYPFVLHMYDLLDSDQIDRQEFLDGLETLECYLVRRFLNRDSTNYTNKMFPALVKEVTSENFVSTLQSELGKRNEPTDARLRQSAETIVQYKKDIYTRQKLALVFATINRQLSVGHGAYTVLEDDPTIEHIMPQKLTPEWKEELGESWQDDYELLHTLGNLTLITQKWNSKLSNSPYHNKRKELAQHGLKLNSDYFSSKATDHWNGESIRKRAEWLMTYVTSIWPQYGKPTTGQNTSPTPRSVTVLGETYPVASWRDVIRRTTDAIVTLAGEEFGSTVAEKLPRYFSQSDFVGASYQLSNGWWVYINLSADDAQTLVVNMLGAAGLEDEDYQITFWEGFDLTPQEMASS